LSSQADFERFLHDGLVGPSQRWSPLSGQEATALRHLVWRYRDRTRRKFGATFLETAGEHQGLALELIAAELRKSSRWGTNFQPSTPDPLVQVLSMLPVFSITMKDEATLVARFLRPLADEEAARLLEAAGLNGGRGEDPFTPGEPKLQAYLWWD
jgi:hypothetical protein